MYKFNCFGIRANIIYIILFNLFIAFQVYADGVTIVTHGWNPSISGSPVWLQSIQNSISNNYLDGEQNYGIITVTKSGMNLTATCDSWNFDMSSGNSGEILIVLNWSEVADHLTGGPPAQDVAEIIIEKIINSQNSKPPLAELPLHLIGHSRGGGMICEIARLLGEKGIIVDHLTPLDPHPLTSSDPQPILYNIIDTPLAIYENVVFADVYLQNSEYPKGNSILGAYNRIWETMNGGYYDNGSVYPNHRNIYLMYQATIDLNNPVNNGEASIDATERSSWFNNDESDGSQTGFSFSRIKGNTIRNNEGLHENQFFAGNGTRQDLLWSEAVWPNILDLQVRINGSELGYGTYTISIGTNIEIRYIAFDYDSNSTVTINADIDRNPYNNNDIMSLFDPIQHTKTGKAFIENNMNLDTSNISHGTEIYIYAKIEDSLHTRYFYSPSHLVFSEKIYLSNVISILQVLVDLPPGTDIKLISDINNDKKIGLEEAIYNLRNAAN